MNPITHRNREIERLERENKALREWIFDTMSTLVSTQNSELGDILTVLNMLSKSAAKVLNSIAHKQVSEHLERELAESREECRRLREALNEARITFVTIQAYRDVESDMDEWQHIEGMIQQAVFGAEQAYLASKVGDK
jgi:predicted RNase H-like nuclease (RuvC/YqgF family)